MNWKKIKGGLFLTIEGIKRKQNKENICTDFKRKECTRYVLRECDDYWKTCWKRYRVKFFNTIQYEGENFDDADRVFDDIIMRIALTVFAVSVISLIWLINI